MGTKSIRINPSSSPRGSVEPESPRQTKPANRTMITKTTSEPSRGEPQVKHPNVSQEVSIEHPKYIHVHHYKQTSLYGAWFNDPSKVGRKRRLFFGSHLTAYLAARAQDRAALKYKPYALDPSSIKLNFKEEDYEADGKLRKILTNDEFGELLRRESRPKYTKMEPTPCLRKFLEEEAAEGNIPVEPPTDNKEILSLKDYLQFVVQKRNMGPGLLPVSSERSAEDDDGSEYEEPDEESDEEPDEEPNNEPDEEPVEEPDEEPDEESYMEDEVEVPVNRNEARKATAVRPMEREKARMALQDSQPASPVQTEITRRFPRRRSGSKLTSPIPPRVDQQEPPALKWGAKRIRSSLASWSNSTKLLLAPRTETKFKITTEIEKMNTESETCEGGAATLTTLKADAAAAVDLQPMDTYNLHLLASTAVAQMLLEASSAFQP